MKNVKEEKMEVRIVMTGLLVDTQEHLKKRKPGVYETEYGNAAEVEDWNSNTAYDIDMAENIPIEIVTDTFIRELD